MSALGIWGLGLMQIHHQMKAMSESGDVRLYESFKLNGEADIVFKAAAMELRTVMNLAFIC